MAKFAAKRTASRNPIATLSEFFQRFEKHSSPAGRIDVYRGHADETFELTPSLFRRKQSRKDEKNIFRELISLHPNEFTSDRTVFEQLVRMQHHSLPTRLLDVTFNPLVALYFACKGHPSGDGQFIRISVPRFQLKYFDSDTVSCVSNLSNLSGIERDLIRRLANNQGLAQSRAGKRLLQFIRAEKPYFLPEIELEDLRKILVVKPKQSNRRILAQQGAFLLFGLTNVLKDNNEIDAKIVRTTIPSDAKAAILRQLDKININESSLFPEIEKAALYIMQQLTPVSGEETD